MIKKNENYIFDENEKSVVKNFTVLKDGKQIASGFVCISDAELLEVYANDSKLALKDCRMEQLLNKNNETTEG